MTDTFFGNTLRDWLTAGLVFAGVILVLLVVRGILVKRLDVMAKRTATDVDDLVVDLLRRVRGYFIFAMALAAALRTLTLPPDVQPIIGVIINVALLFQAGVWGNALIAYLMQRWAGRRDGTPISSTTLNAFSGFLKFVLWSLLVLFALENAFHMNVTPVITGLGVGGVAVALAVQNVLGDLFAALSIVLDKPFDVGDSITVDTMNGTVEHIGLKSTRVRSVEGEQIVFSNTDLLKSRLRNFKRMRERRVVFTLSLDTSPEIAARVPAIMREIIEHTPKARFDRCHFIRFEQAALVFEVVYWVTTPSYEDSRDTLHAVNLGVLKRFPAEGVDWAFPTHHVHVRSTESNVSPSVAGAAGVPGATAAAAAASAAAAKTGTGGPTTNARG